ncbi:MULTISPECIES: amidohydrolase family protein [unclassified Xanthobacter]|uniref:amidohydrolase family protein n=1 Tax=unclassified Xanthobacter TaxID=2623496 RepID=UPI001EDE562D
MPQYFPFDPNPRTPALLPPANACDSQFHVFGDPAIYPVREGAVYEMPSATIEAGLRMHKALGFTRGVIVQATTYGADHRVVVDALKVAGPNYRGCANAAVFASASDEDLADLHAAGIRGARFSRQGLGVSLSDAEFKRALEQVKALGWYVKIQPEAAGVAAQVTPFEALEVPVVIDHMGRPDLTKGREDPSCQKVLDLLTRGNFYVMLSLGEKTSKAGPPWADMIPLARTYIEAAPDRVIWGSDWPHPVSVKQPPNDADLLELLYSYTLSEAERVKILVENPARLFGFPA